LWTHRTVAPTLLATSLGPTPRRNSTMALPLCTTAKGALVLRDSRCSLKRSSRLSFGAVMTTEHPNTYPPSRERTSDLRY
jgi:hypothetical protein